ncbi:hypothetical protein FB446DRAFT_737262 [Lentinula raphanica]|nr:hypothetical protein FB446DRAFT_737262 [Lentinula raphanica]
MGPRECSPSNSFLSSIPLCSLPASCPLQQDAAYWKMPVKTVRRRNSLPDTPNTSHQQHSHPSRTIDSSDDSDSISTSAEFTEQCTDDCHFITCVDPTHKAANCSASGDTLVCHDAEDCSGLDEYLQCCSDLHPYIQPGPKNYFSPYHWQSGSSTEFTSEETDGFSHNHSNVSHGSPYSLHLPDMNQPQNGSPTNLFADNLSSQLQEYPFDYPQQYELGSHPHSTVTSPLLLSNASFSPSPSHMSPSGSPIPPSGLEQQLPPSTNPSSACMWGNCNAHFSSPDDLIKHVNAEHLMLVPPATDVSPTGHQSHADHHKKFSCLWRDCHEFFPDLVDAPSHEKPHPPYDQFTVHILQHLGYPGPNQPPLPKFPDDYPKEYIDMYAHLLPNAQTNPVADPTTSDSSRNSESGPSRSVTPPPFPMEGQEESHQCKASHVCHWNECGLTFDSCNDLTTHLTEVHVGSGKPHYDCYWGKCGRNGQSGFTSKQKICRHLQSHTGHRPFQCKLCHQNFSEAATLQQHMRRHTREKPYVCDHPGCGKSFAITGALTIHKRTHNGYKPFKCTYCDRAFAESSNLSKHLRTHTGARPYTCPEPGCNKSFARPDQLTRHGNVHKKKAKSTASSS